MMGFWRRLREKRYLAVLAAVVVVLAVGAAIAVRVQANSQAVAIQPQAVHIDQVAKLARDGKVSAIALNGDVVTARLSDGSLVAARKEYQVSILETLRNYGVSESQLQEISLEVKDPVAAAGQSGPMTLGLLIVVAVIFIGGLFYIASRTGGAGKYGSFTKSGARMSKPETERRSLTPKVTFQQVAGVQEAKQELQEVVAFLKHPEKFTALGATIPKGVLLVGPPGTGKTLMAKAVAGEAGVPFFSISGSQFVEMFVGVGASRVRDLFARARKAAPSIIFIDEIDAVGRQRSPGMRGGHGGQDEREQTLNQILVEMDGFDGRSGVVVIAATNRPDILDQALLRPGRFDRQVMLDNPDVRGRKAILAIHARGKPLARSVSLDTVARQTPGFSGADLANLMNEAAILAARKGRKAITRADVEEAADRALAGPARKSRVISERERKITAYHELGHALVATALPNCDPVHKVTIIGRGRAGGFTQFIPSEDRSLWARSQFVDTLASILGGHAAEELVFGEVTTGASNDIERATELAQRMVCQYGMSDRFGPMLLGRAEGSMLGRGSFEQRAFSDEMAREIDKEIRGLIDEGRSRARQLLVENREKLEELTSVLLDKETLSGEEFRALLASPARLPKNSRKDPVAQTVVAAEAVEAAEEASEPSTEASSAPSRLARKLKGLPRPSLHGASGEDTGAAAEDVPADAEPA